MKHPTMSQLEAERDAYLLWKEHKQWASTEKERIWIERKLREVEKKIAERR
jgi:hypothetical protein